MTRRLVTLGKLRNGKLEFEDVRCDRCKHWIDREYCEQSVSWNGEPEHKETSAYASDKESYHAKLRTKPEHGCALFTPREGTEGKA